MKTLKGEVVSVSGKKSVLVLVERLVRHPLYQRVMRRKKKYHVHDGMGVDLGDKVVICECRPKSRMKRWRVFKRLSEKKLGTKKRKTAVRTRKGGK